MHIAEYNSPIGNIILAAEDESLCGLWFFGQKYFDEKVFNNAKQDNCLEIFKLTKDWLDRYFNAKNRLHWNYRLPQRGIILDKKFGKFYLIFHMEKQ